MKLDEFIQKLQEIQKQGKGNYLVIDQHYDHIEDIGIDENIKAIVVNEF